jgi:hypothetical protein
MPGTCCFGIKLAYISIMRARQLEVFRTFMLPHCAALIHILQLREAIGIEDDLAR